MTNTNDFINATHPQHQQILNTSYQGFSIETPSDYGTAFDNKFQEALETLDRQGCYQFDMTQPAGLGTKVARTFVSRCLVGEPGSTYKYLGLRMFAHPWTASVDGSSDVFTAIGELNEVMRQRARKLCGALGRPATGSCDFNLTLINRCFPEADIKLKKEPLFEKDLCSVSWHADSSLEHYSTIGCYHYHRLDANAKPWRVALRVVPNAEGPAQGKTVPEADSWAPAVALTLPAQCLYYMLDDFNHHHQHTVLAGGSHRFASTHRVSLKEGHSFAYIQQRCVNVLEDKMSAGRKYARKLCLLLQEVEFEWIRQWFIQGELHRALHAWWAVPMAELMDLFQQVSGRLVLLLRVCKVAVMGSFNKNEEGLTSSMSKKIHKHKQEVEAGSYEEVISHLKEIHGKRIGWESREKDPIYSSCAANLKPIPASGMVCFADTLALAKDLGCAASDSDHLTFLMDLVTSWKDAFVTKSVNKP